MNLSTVSETSLVVIVASIGVYCIALLGWQIGVLNRHRQNLAIGKTGRDNRQNISYGIAIADVFLVCPLVTVAIMLVFMKPLSGLGILALVSFWLVHSSIANTVVSLRFEKPRLSIMWFLVFPFGAVLGVAFLIWLSLNVRILLEEGAL